MDFNKKLRGGLHEDMFGGNEFSCTKYKNGKRRIFFCFYGCGNDYSMDPCEESYCISCNKRYSSCRGGYSYSCSNCYSTVKRSEEDVLMIDWKGNVRDDYRSLYCSKCSDANYDT